MTWNRYRRLLAALWVVSFALAMLGSLYLRWSVSIGPDSSSKLFDALLGQYTPYIGAVLGFTFGEKAPAGSETEKQVVPFRLAMSMSSLWNLVMVGFVVRACLDPNWTSDTIQGIGGFGPMLSWIVAPAIGFFFSKSAGEKSD